MPIAESKPLSIPSPCYLQSCNPQIVQKSNTPVAAPYPGCDEAEACALTAMLAANALAVPFAKVLGATRGSRSAAHARQVAMYLAHVALGVPLAGVGRCFGRDHSTVAHGCRRVEDLRDERGFDGLIAELALAARIASHLDHEVLA